ncbi:Uncharacterized protein Fot_03617 [Forsythia ovata]|uniref:Uncharacterized protein n=1 Tax=Forsythia ovata TaxID=205694 RepID=A0ABD1XD95_9LAMI
MAYTKHKQLNEALAELTKAKDLLAKLGTSGYTDPKGLTETPNSNESTKSRKVGPINFSASTTFPHENMRSSSDRSSTNIKRSALNDCALQELRFHGPIFTWQILFPRGVVQRWDFMKSDHMPLFLQLIGFQEQQIQLRYRRGFRFEQFWFWYGKVDNSGGGIGGSQGDLDPPTFWEKEDGGETKKEEPLIDISEPVTPEAPKIEEVITTEPKVTIEEVIPVEAPKATEAKDESVEPAKVIETVEKPAAGVAAPKS